MNLVKLKIDGFLSYREPVEIDFQDIELACISGANGAGKSSLLDAITWVLFCEARKNNDDIIHNAVNKAEVTLDFEYEGLKYRVQRVKQRGKSTELEFYIQKEDGEWKALTEHSVRETERLITQTLRMDYETFVNASFFLQGRADEFARQKAGDRKRILGNILGLERWEEYKGAAADRRKALEAQKLVCEGSISEIEHELEEEDQRRKDLKEAEKQLAQIEAQVEDKQKTLDAAKSIALLLEEQKRSLLRLEEQVSKNDQQLDELADQINQRMSEQQAYQKILRDEKKIQEGYDVWQNLNRELKDLQKKSNEYLMLDTKRNAFRSAITSQEAELNAELKTLKVQEKRSNP